MILYNQLLAVVQNQPDYVSGTPPPSEVWHHYSNYAQNLDLVKAQALYALIIHHYYLQSQILEPLPYGIKKLSATGGVVLYCQNLPPGLQHLIRAFLDTY